MSLNDLLLNSLVDATHFNDNKNHFQSIRLMMIVYDVSLLTWISYTNVYILNNSLKYDKIYFHNYLFNNE